ncbi:hypothetical protein M747DRAFT_139955 [Aspergillus niger ATCC 13496]|uniref:Uncharacterized protein n=1 Tax=Aspergillus niger ATCC 13496 TaxID=1353008 RepID=A0A370BQ69_ASPNG|nr:hypothetical protein M747DRAFT_139955 [Aspergillus niger ATCC 13496]
MTGGIYSLLSIPIININIGVGTCISYTRVPDPNSISYQYNLVIASYIFLQIHISVRQDHATMS